jgi:subtilisin-like proprotein convertase family protein
MGPRLKSRLRRAALESLERRELLSTSTSTLPTPTITLAASLNAGPTASVAGNALTGDASANSPSVAVDPINPLKMVAVWVDHSVAGFNAGNYVKPVTEYAQGAFSIDGGKHWSTLPGFGVGGVNTQQDFSLTVPTNGTVNKFTQTTDASVGFDRNENVYVLTSSHDDPTNTVTGVSTAGVLDVQRYSFTGNTANRLGVTPIYSWDQPDSTTGANADAAAYPTLAVDSNVPSFTDPTTGVIQTDPFSGNIYVAWAEIDSNTYNGIFSFNPNTIRMTASSDQGLSFTHAAYVDNSSNANGHNSTIVTNPPSNTPLHGSTARYTQPQISISQGSATAGSGGQVSIVYDDYGTGATATPKFDRILVQTDTLGGTSQQFKGVTAGPIPIDPANGVSVPVTVNIPTTTNTMSLQALDVITSISYPTLADFSGVSLTPPTAVNNYLANAFPGQYFGSIPLMAGGFGYAGTGTVKTGPNLGVGSDGSAVGTVFDPEAIRSIADSTATGSASGHFRALGEAFIQALKGLSPAVLNSTGPNNTWTLNIGITGSPDTSTSPKSVNTFTLNFSFGNNPGNLAGNAGAEVTVVGGGTTFQTLIPNINPTNSTAAQAYGFTTNSAGSTGVDGSFASGDGTTTSPTQGTPIFPSPVIAADNTLGSFSPHQNRLYVAFTGMLSNAAPGNTDVFLLFSDNFGKTWSVATQVNDDNAAVDGYSASFVSTSTDPADRSLGRTQYEPQIAVDQSTGSVVLSYLDARHDASNARVDTTIAASSDGGATFAAQSYANPSFLATDAITGNVVNLGPIPDNQSAASGVQDLYGYGNHQALAVVNGKIIPFWASNENNPTNISRLKIVNAILTLTAGPRIISSSQGPVTLTNSTLPSGRSTTDGTTIANTILVTFDRPIDPSTFLPSNVSVFFEAPTGGTQTSLPILGVTPVTSNAFGTTVFKITFDPSSLASIVGTYSYVINPTGISDRIRHVISGGTVATGNVMDQNADGTPGQISGSLITTDTFGTLVGDKYVVGQPTGVTLYSPNTLPLIVPGPHVFAVAAVDAMGNVIGTGTNDLVLNNTVGTLQIAFDRNIQVSTFNSSLNPLPILAIYGPAGPIPLTGLTITPLSFYSNGTQTTYANGGQANLFKIAFATPQQLSGTYSITLGTGIKATDGSGVDSNLNAGLDMLRGTATNGATTSAYYPAATTDVPATIQPLTVNPDGSTMDSILVSPITINDNFVLQGANATTGVSGITLTLDIAFPNDPDLLAYLQAPDGTQIPLFTHIGGGTNTANFSSTTFSDTAKTLIDNAGAPFFVGPFKPEGVFGNLANGTRTSLGTWNLVIDNKGSFTGTLKSWSLTFQKPVSATGLAEDPNDRTTAYFQIFNLAPSNALANSTWTAVGPTGITVSANGKGTFAGAVSTIAVDPSDTTGNTVFVGSASGGIWKTTNFLTTNPGGPTYVPLTDFGPNFSLNIGSIAVFPRNNDPRQTVIFAGTGFGQETTAKSTGGYSNVDLNSGRGVGLIRSTDGGLTWTLLDSLTNADAAGNPLPESQRNQQFIGDTTFKVIVDPKPQLNGQIIVYAALGGPTGGLYQSRDSGNTWQLLSSSITNPNNSPQGQNYTDCTDVILDPYSISPTTGNLGILYAAFPNHGTYISSNQGQTLQLVAGGLGKDPLIVSNGFPAQPIAVGNAGVTPNGASGYIVLGKPALTSNVSVNLNYQDWLYVAVENADGSFNGLYVTKDRGENWTKVNLPNIPLNFSVKAAIPTNDTSGASPTYDPTRSNLSNQGNYNLTLTVDPTNPNIVYLGGSGDFQGSGLIRVDLTNLNDPHNFVSFSNDHTDGGLLQMNAQGGIGVNNVLGTAVYLPPGANPENQLLNLRHIPNNGTPGASPSNLNATLVVDNTLNGFSNTGYGATWSRFDEPLKANAGDTTGSTNLHDTITYVDPITGAVRIIFADDMGVFTALVNPDGTMNNGIGTDVAANYSRNGNLQNEQFFDSAAQPSSLSSQAAGALFYASGQNTIAAQSDQNILTDGNLTWDNSAVLSPPPPSPTSPRATGANGSISTSDRSGVGIATDPTGQTNSVYEFDVPILGGNLTDFFRVDQFGQTTGLAGNVNAEFPQFGLRGTNYGGVTQNGEVPNGQAPIGNFTVNPLNGDQILIGSATGNLYETTNKGIQWLPIGTSNNFNGGLPGNSGFQPAQLSAIAFGAPDPNASGGVGNLNNFIYVGTTGQIGNGLATGTDGLPQNAGHIYLTVAGGNGWTDASSGLDGASVVGIYPAPDRGSHAAYAVTLTGIFYSPDTVALAQSGGTVWTNITSNLTSIQYNPFGNATYQQSVLAGFVGNGQFGTNNKGTAAGTGQYGGFSGIVADYRYQIPAATNTPGGANNLFYPVLYASGYGGVFRSIDNGSTWTVFPNTSFDAAPVDGGYLPHVAVTNIQLVLGDINPATGHATQSTGDPEILLATTFGRGDFAIRLAPNVLPNTIQFDASNPLGGSDSGVSATDLITNVTNPVIDGVSEVSNFGNVVTITLTDESPNSPYKHTVIGTGFTNQLGEFSIQLLNNDPWFNSTSSQSPGDKVVGIQATDSSGASGNKTLFSYTLDLVTPVTPNAPVLNAPYDTGRSGTDGLTDLSVPLQAGPGSPLTFSSAPTFSTLVPPTNNPLIPNPVSLVTELLRSDSPNGPFSEIDSVPTGPNSAATTVVLTDNDLFQLAQLGPIDHRTFYYEVIQIDTAGNVSSPASNVTAITVNTVLPTAPAKPVLSSLSTTTPPMPSFSVAGVLPGDQLLLYRSINGQPAVLAGTGPINNTASTGTFAVTDTLGASPDGVYTYYAAQIDIYGNYSNLSPGLIVTINTQTPPATPILVTDTGRSTTDNITNIQVPAPTPNSTPSYIAPVFNVNVATQPTGQPPVSTVQLFRSSSPNGTFTLVGSAAYGGANPGVVADTDILNLAAAGPIDQYFYYEADQINAAGIESRFSPVLAVFVNTKVPATLPTPTLDPASNSGLDKTKNITNVTNPTFDATNLLPADPLLLNNSLGNQLLLYRSFGGAAAILVGTGPINTTGGAINAMVTDTVGAKVDGTYVYTVVQRDVAGNISNLSLPLAVTINTTIPIAPTITLPASDDSGLPSHPNVTNVQTPHFSGLAQYGTPTNFPVDLLTGEAAASTGSVPINPTGIVTSNSTSLTIPAGATPVAGYVTLALKNKSTGVSGNIGNLSVALIGPGGQSFFLLQASPTNNSTILTSPGFNTTTVQSQNFNIPASFFTGVLSGVYKLAVSDSTTGDVGQITSFSVTLVNRTSGSSGGPTLLNSVATFPASNNTYLSQVTNKLADGVYTIVARSTNQAGSYNYSPGLTVTIKANGPVVVPTLAILPADDTGVKGDGITANHNPRFTGVTDKGVTVNLYALIGGVLQGPEATTTSSTADGSFTFKLPFNLTDGTAQLYAQAVDVAGNKGPYSAALTVQIVTTTGDYVGSGAAQLTVFNPANEAYYIRGVGAIQVDTTPGRDVPIQYDFNGDGQTDSAAYRFDSATYFGYVSNGTGVNQQFGPYQSLPVSGFYGSSGTFVYGTYVVSTAQWSIALPQANGLVVNFGVPKVDIPTPAAFDGIVSSTELAVFRNVANAGGSADSYSVIGPRGVYSVSFTDPVVTAKGFVYKAGDIPAPADYDGVGRDEFAIYRPSTGQFFILNTPSTTNKSTWTLRTVTLNLPGGPNVNDVPASQDYDGNGKADPTVYRPSNSTFYLIHSSTGIQENIQFGSPNTFIAAGGPLLYRLTALKGQYASNGGYSPSANGGGGGVGSAAISLPGGGAVHALSVTSPSAGNATSASAASPLSTMIAIASPIAVTPTTPTTPAKAATPAPSAASSPISLAVTVGATTPSASVATTTSAKSSSTKAHASKTLKATHLASTPVETKAHAAHPSTPAAGSAAKVHHAAQAGAKAPSAASTALRKLTAAVPALQGLVMARKGSKKS